MYLQSSSFSWQGFEYSYVGLQYSAQCIKQLKKCFRLRKCCSRGINTLRSALKFVADSAGIPILDPGCNSFEYLIRHQILHNDKKSLWAVHILCQPKMGSPDPLPALSAQNQKMSYPSPSLVRQNQKLANPPSPFSKIICCCIPFNHIKYTFSGGNFKFGKKQSKWKL